MKKLHIIVSGQIGGITIENVTMVNVGTPIQIGNTPIDFINPSPYDHLFAASVFYRISLRRTN